MARAVDRTVPYLPPLRLWEVRLDGQAPRAITPAEVSYEQPDVHDSGLVAAARMRMRFDVWRFPFGRVAADNVRQGVAVTRQTGQVLTPTAAPDGDRDRVSVRQWRAQQSLGDRPRGVETFGRSRSRTIPRCRSARRCGRRTGTRSRLSRRRACTGLEFGVWLVNPDGSNLRNLAMSGLGMAWSPDGKWLYYADTSAGALKKVEASGGTPVTVRSEPTRNVIGLSGETLYYMVERPLVDGRPEFDIRAATPEDGPSRLLARIPASRVPSWQIVNPALSPDGQWLAVPLTDGFTTNIWALSTRERRVAAGDRFRRPRDFHRAHGCHGRRMEDPSSRRLVKAMPTSSCWTACSALISGWRRPAAWRRPGSRPWRTA